MRKIAFCFLLYDRINHEELWNIFFANVNPELYTIYIHQKNDIPLTYFEKYKLSRKIETRYADISVVLAQNLLYEEALRDPDNTHFILVSNSCIPIKSFKYVYDNLDPAFSYFNICPQNQCFPRCSAVESRIDRKYIQKQHQWCILNRKHAELLVRNTEYIEWYRDIACADEHCYITYMFYRNLQDEISFTPNLGIGATTFTNWSDQDYIFKNNGPGLKNYAKISIEEVRYLLTCRSFLHVNLMLNVLIF